jgi:hypothetical protein
MNRAQRLWWMAGITALLAGVGFGYFALRPLPRDQDAANPDAGYLVDSSAASVAESLASPPPRPAPYGIDSAAVLAGGMPVGGEEPVADSPGEDGATRLGPVLLDTPRPNQIAQSPLWIAGRARGSWFFEAEFPVRLLDARDSVVARGVARATGDWMTPEYVPFSLTLDFEPPDTEEGTLILERSNPSDLPEHAASVRLPVRFR